MNSNLPDAHLARIRAFFDATAGRPTRVSNSYHRTIARYYRLLVAPESSVLEIGCGAGGLLATLDCRTKTGIDLSARQLELARQRVPTGVFLQQAGETLELEGTYDTIILSDTLSHASDVQALLSRLQRNAHPRTRLILNYHNTLWRPLLALGEWVGLRRRPPLNNWLSRQDVAQLLELSGWEVVNTQSRLLWPLDTPVVAPLLNRWVAPLFPSLCAAIFTIARPRPVQPPAALSVSVVIPARNECGNIAAAVQRTPQLGLWTELIFIEGHSSDNTWAEIERVRAAHPSLRIKTLRQTGKGKGNAVREAFAVAEGDILMILDADLTMPPENLPKFYEALTHNRCEFANGSRLVYPMEREAMRFLNMIANKCFGILFSWLLGQHVKDTLCGTKALRRTDYLRIAANRAYFGDFDPFGDFDLLFGANKLNLKIVDIPIRYRDRTYGETNIQRWRHGWLLLRMVLFAARKLKFV